MKSIWKYRLLLSHFFLNIIQVAQRLWSHERKRLVAFDVIFRLTATDSELTMSMLVIYESNRRNVNAIERRRTASTSRADVEKSFYLLSRPSMADDDTFSVLTPSQMHTDILRVQWQAVSLTTKNDTRYIEMLSSILLVGHGAYSLLSWLAVEISYSAC